MAAVLPSYVRRSLTEPEPPPAAGQGSFAPTRARLLGRPASVVLTIVSAGIIALVVWPAIRFLLIDAVWDGTSRADCLRETVGREVGACWPFIGAKLPQLMYGFYPQSERWRVGVVYATGVPLLIPLLIPRLPYKAMNAILFFGVFPVLAFFLLVGDVFGLVHVET